MSERACKACLGSWPDADHFIADLGQTKLYLHDDQYFAGWTVLVLQRHATELFHLDPAERRQLIEDVTLTANTLAQVFQATKINYELLGNQLPHIHWHLIPRLTNDPAPLEPVWRVTHEPVRLSGPPLRDRIDRVAGAIRQAR